MNFQLRKLLKHKKILLKSLGAFAMIIATAAASTPSFNTVAVAVNSASRKLPIYCVETSDKKVAISFDAAWGTDETEIILDILKKYNIRATFFLCGYWINKNPDFVKGIYESGHDIGNHGDTHAHGAQLTLEQNRKEILGVHDKIKDILGIDINLFRPPYGEYNNTVIDAADSLNYYTIQWDVESLVIKFKPVITRITGFLCLL